MKLLVSKAIDRLWMPAFALVVLAVLPLIGIELSDASKSTVEISIVSLIVYSLGHLGARGIRERKDDDQ